MFPSQVVTAERTAQRGNTIFFIGYTAIAKDSGSAGFLREGNYNPIPKLHVKFDI